MAAKYRIFAAVFLSMIALFATVAIGTPASSDPRPARAARPTPTPAPPKALPDGIAEPPAYKPGAIPFHVGERLLYQASWAGIPAATARVELHRKKKDPSTLSAEAWIETNKVVDVLFKMRDYMSEDVQQASIQPQRMYMRQSEKTRLNDFNVTFDRSQSVVTLVKSNHRGKQVKQFISTNPWGPLSGAMMALSLPMELGQRYSMDVFTGSTRYIFAFKVAGREKITTSLGTFDAFRLVPDVVYESDGKLSQSATGTTIWVTADGRHLPLRAESQAFIGKVRADLVQISG